MTINAGSVSTSFDIDLSAATLQLRQIAEQLNVAINASDQAITRIGQVTQSISADISGFTQSYTQSTQAIAAASAAMATQVTSSFALVNKSIAGSSAAAGGKKPGKVLPFDVEQPEGIKLPYPVEIPDADRLLGSGAVPNFSSDGKDAESLSFNYNKATRSLRELISVSGFIAPSLIFPIRTAVVSVQLLGAASKIVAGQVFGLKLPGDAVAQSFSQARTAAANAVQSFTLLGSISKITSGSISAAASAFARIGSTIAAFTTNARAPVAAIRALAASIQGGLVASLSSVGGLLATVGSAMATLASGGLEAIIAGVKIATVAVAGFAASIAIVLAPIALLGGAIAAVGAGFFKLGAAVGNFVFGIDTQAEKTRNARIEMGNLANEVIKLRQELQVQSGLENATPITDQIREEIAGVAKAISDLRDGIPSNVDAINKSLEQIGTARLEQGADAASTALDRLGKELAKARETFNKGVTSDSLKLGSDQDPLVFRQLVIERRKAADASFDEAKASREVAIEAAKLMEQYDELAKSVNEYRTALAQLAPAQEFIASEIGKLSIAAAKSRSEANKAIADSASVVKGLLDAGLSESEVKANAIRDNIRSVREAIALLDNDRANQEAVLAKATGPAIENARARIAEIDRQRAQLIQAIVTGEESITQVFIDEARERQAAEDQAEQNRLEKLERRKRAAEDFAATIERVTIETIRARGDVEQADRREEEVRHRERIAEIRQAADIEESARAIAIAAENKFHAARLANIAREAFERTDQYRQEQEVVQNAQRQQEADNRLADLREQDRIAEINGDIQLQLELRDQILDVIRNMTDEQRRIVELERESARLAREKAAAVRQSLADARRFGSANDVAEAARRGQSAIASGSSALDIRAGLRQGLRGAGGIDAAIQIGEEFAFLLNEEEQAIVDQLKKTYTSSERARLRESIRDIQNKRQVLQEEVDNIIGEEAAKQSRTRPAFNTRIGSGVAGAPNFVGPVVPLGAPASPQFVGPPSPFDTVPPTGEFVGPIVPEQSPLDSTLKLIRDQVDKFVSVGEDFSAAALQLGDAVVSAMSTITDKLSEAVDRLNENTQSISQIEKSALLLNIEGR